MKRMMVGLIVAGVGGCGAPTWHDNCVQDGCTDGQVCVEGGGTPICRDLPEDCNAPVDSCDVEPLLTDACGIALCGVSLDGEYDTECFSGKDALLYSFDCDPSIEGF